jgi:hypothetical protein
VAFAASPEALDLDAGGPLLLLRDAVAAAGMEPAVAVWEDATVEWSRFDPVVAIYTWGYVTRRERFLEWPRRRDRARALRRALQPRGRQAGGARGGRRAGIRIVGAAGRLGARPARRSASARRALRRDAAASRGYVPQNVR